MAWTIEAGRILISGFPAAGVMHVTAAVVRGGAPTVLSAAMALGEIFDSDGSSVSVWIDKGLLSRLDVFWSGGARPEVLPAISSLRNHRRG